MSKTRRVNASVGRSHNEDDETLRAFKLRKKKIKKTVARRNRAQRHADLMRATNQIAFKRV